MNPKNEIVLKEASSEPIIKTIPVNKTQIIQTRREIDHERVSDYATAIKGGIKFPPITAFFDGGTYFVSDGDHRLRAHRELGITEIEAFVQSGNLRDATLAAVGANATHGLPRTNSDKRKAVETLLGDSQWTVWSDNAIAGACHVSRDLVVSVRESMGLKANHRKV